VIVFRIQVHIAGDWLNIWIPWLGGAEANLVSWEKDGYEARLDQIDVGAGREGLCRLLNLADANHINLEGELIARTSHLDPRGISCQ
jgi:hypothetical protein